MIEKLQPLYKNLTGVVLGSETSSLLMILGVLSNGHVLIQDAPGLGKTTLARALAGSIKCQFKRIQFTPDLLPTDILGYSLFNQGRGEFDFIEGPIFSNVVLADEINRTSPRIQSALLEAMNEGQVSIDGKTHQLQKPFLVIATQNNLYSTGTFPLPEPQLDRFLLSFRMGLPSPAMQIKILEIHSNDSPIARVAPVISKEEILEMQKEVLEVEISPNLMQYVVELSEATRKSPGLVSGVSPRGSLALMKAAQAFAYISGRKAIYPDDIKKMIFPVFGHRLSLKNLQGKGGTSVTGYLEEILQGTPVP